MSSKNYNLKPLQWDTDYFGIKSAKVSLNGIIDLKSQAEIKSFCDDYNFITIANIGNLKENNYWLGSKTAAFLTDLNVQFIKTVDNNSISKQGCSDTVVINKLPYNQQIVNIAHQTFKYSRFFNDPHLPSRQSKSIYLHWTKCAFGQPDKYFVIYQKKDEVAGYILFSLLDGHAVIELIAIDKKYQGKKMGAALIDSLALYILNKGLNKIKVGTQIDNIRATQFYISNGFRYLSCSSIYHLWNQ